MAKSNSDRLTHAGVARELREAFGNTTFARGMGIHRSDGAVQLLSAGEIEPGEYVVQGEVQGSAAAPYTTTVEVFADLFRGEFDVLDSECTCPVANDCKHACALLLSWVERWPGANRRATDSRESPLFDGIAEIAPQAVSPDMTPAGKAAPRKSNGAKGQNAQNGKATPPPPKVRTLPVRPDLQAWLRRSIDAAQQQDKVAKSKVPSFLPCIFFVLTDAAQLYAVRGRRRRDGTETELTGELAKTAWLDYGHELPSYAVPTDVAILKLFGTAQPEYRYESNAVTRVEGELGYQLLSLAAASGRLYAHTEAMLAKALDKRADIALRRLGKPLVFGEARAASLTWRQVDKAKASHLRLGATLEGQDVSLVPTVPPYALDVEANRIVPVSMALSARSLAHLAALPPLPLDDAIAWSYVRDAIDALPDAATVPPLPLDDSVRLAIPRAMLSFNLFELHYQVGWGRNARTESTTFPAAQLSFEYAGRRVPISLQGLDNAIEVEEAGKRSSIALVRNVRAETQWLSRMPPLLQRAVHVEHVLAQAQYDERTAAYSLWALPRHDWASDGAEVFAAAQAAGYVIEVDAAFPLALEDISEPELELSPAPERGWFRIALGVTVQGRRVDLAPALAKLIGAQADPEAWLAALPSVPMVLLSIAPKKGTMQSAVVRLPGERVHAILSPVFDWFRGGSLEPISGIQAALNADLPVSAVRYLGRDDQRWIALREAVAAGTTFKPIAPHADFRATLRPYQLHGLSWLEHLRTLSMAGVLADDMGLGKTVQTLAFLHRRRKADGAARPSLIVAPTSVTVNWLAEAARFAPDLKVHLHRGAARSLDAAAVRDADLLVTSYPILQRDEKRFAEMAFDVVVFDEAQMLKNARAKTYQGAQLLAANMRVALTGTPMENHLGELWALFNLLSPGLLGDLDSFNRVFRHPIEQRAADEQMKKLRARIRPFLLRRTRGEVLDDLPEKTEYTRWIELNAGQADLYESLRTAIHDDIRRVIDKKGLKQSTIHILDALLKLRQVCCDPRLVKLPEAKKHFADAGSAKLDWLMSHVPALIEDGHRVLIFSQFTSMLALIAEGLTERGIEYVTLTGDTTDRNTPIARFQSGAVRVFLLSLKAGGVGLNLTAADTVIHYDPWWNPAVEAQATARAHRIGQTNPVFVTRLVSQGTLEERMMTMLARKRELAAALLEGEGSALTGLTMADVEELLAPISTFVAQTR